MAATFSDTIAADDDSGDITVTANAVFSVNTDKPVVVEAKNSATGGPTWVPIYRLGIADSKALIATSETIRVKNEGTETARVEVFA